MCFAPRLCRNRLWRPPEFAFWKCRQKVKRRHAETTQEQEEFWITRIRWRLNSLFHTILPSFGEAEPLYMVRNLKSSNLMFKSFNTISLRQLLVGLWRMRKQKREERAHVLYEVHNSEAVGPPWDHSGTMPTALTFLLCQRMQFTQ